MTKTEKSDLQKVLKLITDAVEGRLSKLPPGVADVKRKEIHKIAAEIGTSGRGKPAKSPKTRANRSSARSRK